MDILFFILSLILAPAFLLIVISFNSTYLITVFIRILLIILVLGIVASLAFYAIYTKWFRKTIFAKKWARAIIGVSIVGCFAVQVLLYGPFSGFRTWFIIASMNTMNHSYLCQWFYNDDQIAEVFKENYYKEIDEEQDLGLISPNGISVGKLEKELKNTIKKWDATVEIKNENYVLISQKVNGQDAYVVLCLDPSKVVLGYSTKLSSGAGEYVTKQAERKDALLGMNAAGFYDPDSSSAGGNPMGLTISQGKVISNDKSSYRYDGGLIGFDSDNKFVMIKQISASEALGRGIRDAVTWGPYLVVNGKSLLVKGTGGMGYAARTAIGQRADGVVIFLVVDSNASRSKGATMLDLAEIMVDYGAINAANLDGGTSSVLAMPSSVALSVNPNAKTDNYSKEYRFVNDPIDSTLSHKTRPIADSWLLLK